MTKKRMTKIANDKNKTNDKKKANDKNAENKH